MQFPGGQAVRKMEAKAGMTTGIGFQRWSPIGRFLEDVAEAWGEGGLGDLGAAIRAGNVSSVPASFAVSAPTDLVGCFAVLGGSAVTSTGSTVVSGGDLGIYPAAGAAVTGFTFSSPTGPGIVTGAPATVHLTDAVADNAQGDLILAYNSAEGLTGAVPLTGQDLGTFNLSTPLTPGVYKFTSTAQLTGTLALDAQNDADAVFVFQIGSTLTTASSSQVVLLNGAQARNVIWQVGSSATLGTNSTFEGAILAYASITANSGANIQGRALASIGAVTLSGNTVTGP